ncbi:hypothetical protein BpHYR1_038221 [Brachionus plicatilis]|uniref:Uncharacterized protein n=1 Tax=Brachionus plicatilis TaxID=10195 RepID=A0A3M7SIS7_BRAPC|nr:hypothetical protein BpHYR1_038221 [Brachionus plicatilis]
MESENSNLFIICVVDLLINTTEPSKEPLAIKSSLLVSKVTRDSLIPLVGAVTVNVSMPVSMGIMRISELSEFLKNRIDVFKLVTMSPFSIL